MNSDYYCVFLSFFFFFALLCGLPLGFSGDSAVKNSPANAGDVGLIPGLGISPGEGNDNPPSILVWEIPWTEEPGGL